MQLAESAVFVVLFVALGVGQLRAALQLRSQSSERFPEGSHFADPFIRRHQLIRLYTGIVGSSLLAIVFAVSLLRAIG